ncbi:hypothetical protein [Nocardia sp. CY41]|uniref:hypothetical protein n=1 Tax=Nocardia sp. CY41 TaxID=2608686 RepID=UPI001357F7D4|nr:hypothetical protein [Nocardia sp. CY41]
MTTTDNDPHRRLLFVSRSLFVDTAAHCGRHEVHTPARGPSSPHPAIGNIYAVVREGGRDQRYRVLLWDAEGNALITDPGGRLQIASHRRGFVRLEGGPSPAAE